jgi:hypothetical protein
MNGYGVFVEWYRQGTTEVLGEKPVPVPLCPPQISHLPAWTMVQLAPDRAEGWASHSGRFTRCPWIWGRVGPRDNSYILLWRNMFCPSRESNYDSPVFQSADSSLHRLNMGRYWIREHRIRWSLVLEESLALTTLCQPRYDGKKFLE